MRTYQAIIFDLYGTLIEQKRRFHPYERCISLLNDKNVLRKDIKPREVALTEDLPSISSFVQRVTWEFKGTSDEWERDLEKEVRSVRLFEETERVLRTLKGKGFLLGMISNLASPYKWFPDRQLISSLMDGEVFSCEVGWYKPQPEIYWLLVDQLAVDPSHMLMVGDYWKEDVIGPRSIGADSLYLDRSGRIKGAIQSLDEVLAIATNTDKRSDYA